MIAGRLRQCLAILRWTQADLAEELGVPVEQTGDWLSGRTRVPVAVAAWLEALVKAHRSVPKPDILESKAILGHLASAMHSSRHSSGILQ
ncbi:MAG: helix-turn-helix transcriptional regulator [Mesorhizobium sp.]